MRGKSLSAVPCAHEASRIPETSRDRRQGLLIHDRGGGSQELVYLRRQALGDLPVDYHVKVVPARRTTSYQKRQEKQAGELGGCSIHADGQRPGVAKAAAKG